jgi:hypothetical protein
LSFLIFDALLFPLGFLPCLFTAAFRAGLRERRAVLLPRRGGFAFLILAIKNTINLMPSESGLGEEVPQAAYMDINLNPSTRFRGYLHRAKASLTSTGSIW